jgi:hypothetical protein
MKNRRMFFGRGYRIIYTMIGFLKNSIGFETHREKLGFTPGGRYPEFDI